ncbi:adenosine deaminase [Legionella rubrilucens]|uniref:adenosine deaminase n=1 Tax=Legionella rubrilucens TaxID=458 RepID=A0A0W0XW36_9GAMM|nr:adenosine deaminase [Legionella rubrilucens]KTD48510.1 adenosine deaminase [Legionella rubrilucens]
MFSVRHVLLSFLVYQSACFAHVNQYVDTIKNDPNALYAFFKAMPKGGELHYHLAGGAYPEAMLAVAAKHEYCLDTTTFAISKTTEACRGIPARELRQHPEIYANTVRAWSMKDFIPGTESGHDHFFASFMKFIPLVANHDAELLSEVMLRAADQHEHYMEIMILPDNGASIAFADPSFTLTRMEAMKKKLLGNPGFIDTINKTVNKSDHLLNEAQSFLNCGQKLKQPVCGLTVRFQYYVLREQTLDKVFAQALHGFEAASRSKSLVAVNLVQPEDGYLSLRDYREQMKIFEFLHQNYPEVPIALHAGELAPQDVVPADTRFHIRDAMLVGNASRIGHGVDIAHEDNPEEIMRLLKEKNMAVEINLISNKAILAIAGKQHPLNYYLKHQVPVVLSTDDEGILRTDLTAQYVEAVLHHQLDYPALKQINRNALTFSFLPGESLWSKSQPGVSVPQCKDLNSASCLKFIQGSKKAQLQRQLELQLAAFEKRYDQ